MSELLKALKENDIDGLKRMIQEREVLSDEEIAAASKFVVEKGLEDQIKPLMRKGLDLNTMEISGGSLVLRATTMLNRIMLKELLNNGADPNRGNGKASPLMEACWIASPNMVKILLENGADPNLKFGEFSALSCADNQEVIEMLLSAGADPNVRMKEGFSALLHFTLRRKTEVVDMLLRNGADVRGLDYENPLLGAVEGGPLELVELLLKHGADPRSKKSKEQRSPLEAVMKLKGANDFTDLIISAAEKWDLDEEARTEPQQRKAKRI